MTTTTEKTLTAGIRYEVESLELTDWTDADDDRYVDWANYADYFAPDGRYLGPDKDGVEPMFRASSIREI